LRIIKLQLNPGDLGSVTIVVSGTDDNLRIELAAELADTVTKVENDRGVLAARLNGAGYTVGEISVARFAGQGMDGDSRDQGPRQGTPQEQHFGQGGARDGGAQFGGQHNGRQSGASSFHAEIGMGPDRGAAAGPVAAGVSYASRFRPI
jgi:chemotaxis protein MotD